MTIDKYSKTGEYHRIHSSPNQDFMYSMEGNDYVCIMLADGVSSCRNGYDGARLACMAMSQIIERERNIIMNYSTKKIAYLITEHILFVLEKNFGKEIAEYGSTFMCVYIEKTTGKCLVVNLGDGAVLSQSRNMGYSYISAPKRFRGNPCLTITENSSKYMDVQYLDNNFSTIILCTDGFLNMLDDSEITSMLSCYNVEKLNRLIDSKCNMDDCSYISVSGLKN